MVDGFHFGCLVYYDIAPSVDRESSSSHSHRIGGRLITTKTGPGSAQYDRIL